MSEQIVTLWDDTDLSAAVHSAETAKFIRYAKPQAVQFHAKAETLSTQGAALTAYVRATFPEVRVEWAIAGDWHVPSVPGPVPFWASAGRAAVNEGVLGVQLNCELGGWKDKPDVAAAAVAHLAADVPGLEIGFTSYGSVVSKNAEGMPFQAFLARWRGMQSPVSRSAQQTYFANAANAGNRAFGEHWIAEYAGQITLAYGRGLIGAEVEPEIYVQAYWAPCTALCQAPGNARRVYWWTIPRHFDTQGAYAVASLSELHRRGRGIVEFQQESGIKVDGLVGPDTRAALGVGVWVP